MATPSSCSLPAESILGAAEPRVTADSDMHLISFLDLGPAAGAPPSFHRGRAKILVRAVGQTGAFDATLAVDCKFGPPPPPPPDFEEGTFFAIAGGLNFNEVVDEAHIFNQFVAVSED